MASSRFVWMWAVGSIACEGAIGDAAPPVIPEGGCVGDECLTLEESPSPSHRFVRLSHGQWENTIRDLFRLDAPVGLSSGFYPDPPGLAAFDTDERRLGMTDELWNDYQEAAEAVADQMTRDDLSAWSDTPESEGIDAFVRRFGARAYRRPLAEAEVARYATLASGAPALYPEMDAYRASVRVLLEAFLQSPFFVYRAERSEAEAGGVIPLDDYELASRLSYFMWDTMPDDALFDAAESGAIADPEGLRAQAERMFDDPRTRAKLARFHDQLYEIDEWDGTTHDLPEWRPELASMMQEDTRRFIDGVIFGGGGIRELLTSTTAYVNEDLAPFYGVDGITGPEFRAVELDPAERAGLLTRLGMLTKRSDHPDPVHRGVLIVRNVLCRTLPPPPIFPPMAMTGETNRERYESITGPGSCAESCHTYGINPLGFAFESFDALGRFRTEDNGHPIDDAATYVTEDGEEVSFDGPIELARALAEREEPHRCYATKLLEFQYGRGVSDGDSPWIYRAAEGSREGAPIRELFTELIASRTFRTRAVDELAIATATEEGP